MNINIPDNLFCEEELNNTPNRYAKFLKEWTCDDDKFVFTMFKTDNNQMIICKDLQFYSMCSHHLLPFFGTASIGYIPNNGNICGLSKIPRVVDKFAHRPQIQEKLTQEILNFLIKNLEPKWCIVVLKAEHLCMSMRGIKKPGHQTITSAIFPDPEASNKFVNTKTEFLQLTGGY